MHNQSDRQTLIEAYGLLDAPNELEYDILTEELAKEINCLGATISIVGENRVWFKSRYGILVDEVNVECSLSRELVLSEQALLVIEKFSTDKKYKDHYSHTILGYEFFAATPIYLDNGITVGAVCVFDFSPKKLTPGEISKLIVKANQVARLIQEKKSNFEELEAISSKESNIVKKTSSLGDFGGFYANTSTNELKWNSINNRIFNLKNSWTPQFNDLINPLFSKHFRANNDVFRIMKEIQVLIQSSGITQYSHLYTINFGLPQLLYVNMIYHRNGDDIYVVFKNESRFLELAHKDYVKKSFLQEVESISKIGGWEFNLLTNKLQFSRNATRILDLKAVPTATLKSLKVPNKVKDFEALKNGFSQAIRNRNEYTGDHEYKTVNKPGKTLRVNGKPIFKKEICERIVGTIQDITEDKANMELLSIINTNIEQQVSFYKSLVNNNNIFILQLAADGNVLFSNKPFNLVYGGTEDELALVGRNEFDVCSEKNKNKLKQVIARCLENPGRSFPLFMDRKNDAGTNTLTKWDCCSIGKKDNSTPDILFIGIDITELKESKEKLLQLVDKVTLQNQRSIEFGNIVNHHVRSQVANLQGLIQLIELMNTPEEKMEYFSHLEKTVKNLNEITNIVSTVLHIQNKAVVEKTVVNVEELLDSIVSEFWEDLLTQAIKIDIQIPPYFTLVTVKNYLLFTLKELISNAIRFRKPDIELQLKISAYKKGESNIFVISDNGKGIDMELYKDRLFTLYDTLIPHAHFKGTGLYLSRVRINALGGNLRIESTPNEGTSVFIEIPDEKN